MSSVIGLVTYNGDNPKYLLKCLRSIDIANVMNLDKIVCLNGRISKKSLSYFKKYNWEIIYNEGLSLASGLNRLYKYIIKKSIYKYIYRMDTDDLMSTQRLIIQEAYLAKNPNVDVFGGMIVEFEKKYKILGISKKNSKKIKDTAIYRSPLMHPTVCFKVDFLKKILEDRGYVYCENTISSEDIELWHYIINKGYVIKVIDDILVFFRRDDLFFQRRSLSKRLNELKLYYKFYFKLKKIKIIPFSKLILRSLISFLPINALKIIYNARLK
jgi:hypothetical protein